MALDLEVIAPKTIVGQYFLLESSGIEECCNKFTAQIVLSRGKNLALPSQEAAALASRPRRRGHKRLRPPHKSCYHHQLFRLLLQTTRPGSSNDHLPLGKYTNLLIHLGLILPFVYG